MKGAWGEGERNRIGAILEDSLADVIEIRLPANSEYLSVLRAAVGVLAGSMSFNYDEIIQLRVAVSEAFNMAVRGFAPGGTDPLSQQVTVQFVVQTDQIEVIIPSLADYTVPSASEEEIESQALLESLMDEVEYGSGSPGQPIVRMAKYHSVSEN